MRVRTLVPAVVVVAAGTLLSAQQPPEQPPAFRTGVELVAVDVRVLDRLGQPISGLQPDDFVVTVAGEPRRVVTAEFVEALPRDPRRRLAPDEIGVSTNEGGGGGRQFVFVVDQNTLEPGATRYVTRAASRFFARLTPSDRSGLLVMPVGPNVQFTWAHDRVQAALQKVIGHGGQAAQWEFGSLTEARDIANRNYMTLRTVGQRECRGSGFASGSGGGGGAPIGGGAGGGQAGSGEGGTGGGGGTATGEGGAGGTGGGGGGGGARGGGSVGFGFGSDTCTRDLQMQAETTWRTVQMTSQASITMLRQLLSGLARVGGDKSIVLITGGWPLDERDQTSLMSTVADEAAAARVTIFTIYVPASMVTASRRMMSSTPSLDQHLQSWPLDTLASMTGGTAFKAEVSADNAFERLERELTGYYRIGVEKVPADADGRARRLKIAVNREGTTVRARETFDVRTYQDRDWAARLRAAVEAPGLATGLGLRVTTYQAPDDEDDRQVKLVLAGEVSRVQPGEATFQVLVRDLEGNQVMAGEQPLGGASSDVLPFSMNMPVPPGSYILRVAVMDSAGRVGSVDHRTDVGLVRVGDLSAAGPVLVRVPGSSPSREPALALDGVGQDERLALQISLRGENSRLAGAEVTFQVAATDAGPALVESPASLSHERPGSALAQGLLDTRVLPPGRYIARAIVTAAGEMVGDVRRPFVIRQASAAPVMAGTTPAVVTNAGAASASLALRAAGAIDAFAVDQVLAPAVLGAFLDRVAARPDAASPGLRELIDQARAGGLDRLAVPEAAASGAPAPAAFLRGLILLAQKKLDPAADAFRSAMRASPDFYPAMVYLGACYAAGGLDKEASGAWRTALIKEGESEALHLLLADALLRQRRGDLALPILTDARARWPGHDELDRRFVTAALLAGEHGTGLRALDGLIERDADDEPTLALALQLLYEQLTAGRPVESAAQDRARMVRLADAYRVRGGPSMALIETWLAAVDARP